MDYEKFTTQNSRVRQEERYVYDNFKLRTTQQVIHVHAHDKAYWFGAPKHIVLWKEIQAMTKAIQGRKTWIEAYAGLTLVALIVRTVIT